MLQIMQVTIRADHGPDLKQLYKPSSAFSSHNFVTKFVKEREKSIS